MKDHPQLEVLVSAPRALAIEEGFGPSNEGEQHAKPSDRISDVMSVSIDTFLATWQKAFDAVDAVFDSQADHEQRSFEVDSITAKLALSAKGKVAFVGELGGQVAFEVVFKRR